MRSPIALAFLALAAACGGIVERAPDADPPWTRTPACSGAGAVRARRGGGHRDALRRRAFGAGAP